jgi:lysophospholipase L1-like esterase
MTWGLPPAPKWAWAILISGLVALVALTSLTLLRPAPRSTGTAPASTSPSTASTSSGPATTTSAPAPTRMLVIGDSYTGGSNEGGVGAAGWPRLLGERLEADGYRTVIDVSASGGSGYIQPGPPGTTFVQLAEQARNAYAVVIFFGSRNDVAPAGDVRQAATEAYQKVRETSPDARLLIIGPAWVNDNPPPNVRAARDGLARAAEDAGATFVDPLEEGWFSGTYKTLIGADGVHPTDQGHAHMADLIVPHVRAELDALRSSATPSG